jgi:hypothetical protein
MLPALEVLQGVVSTVTQNPAISWQSAPERFPILLEKQFIADNL